MSKEQELKAAWDKYAEDAIVQRSLRAFMPCLECNGRGFVTESDPGGGLAFKTFLCGECHGSGTACE